MLNTSRRSLVVVVCIMMIAACIDSPLGPARGATQWHDLGAIPGVSSALSMTVQGARVFVGTNLGIYSTRLDGSSQWTRVGPDGLDVHVLRTVTSPGPMILAGGYPTIAGAPTFARSLDGGNTWTTFTDGLRHRITDVPLGMNDLTVQPATGPASTPVLYAAMSGTSVARSLDGGESWSYFIGTAEEYATYDCVLHILNARPTRLFQGCEAPLDDSWIRQYDLSAAAGGSLELVDGERLPLALSNRRVNLLTSVPSRPGVLYAGVEGGLMRLGPTGSASWLYKVESSGNRLYTYVRFVWVDPADPAHVVFGGGVRAEDSRREGLHETFDGGQTTHVVQGPVNLSFARAAVPAGVVLDEGGRQFAIVVDDGSAIRVLVRAR